MRPLHRARVLLAINAAYEAHLALGMPLEGYPGETIQCRNETDRTNWLGLDKICADTMRDEQAFYEGLGLPVPEVLGDYPIPEPGIRCTSNSFIRPTVAEVADLMRAVTVYAMTSQAVWWGLKDAVAGAETREQLNAIEAGLTGAWG